MSRQHITNRTTTITEFLQDVEAHDYSYASVVKAFKELIERNAAHEQNISQAVSVDIGKKHNEGFLSFLHSCFKNPLVTIRYCGDEPQLRVSSFDKHNGGSATLNLNMMENIIVQEKRVGSTFLTYDMSFYYSPADMDYMIQVIVKC